MDSTTLRDRFRRLSRVRARDLVESAVVICVASRAEWSLRYRTLPTTARALGIGIAAVDPVLREAISAPDRFALPEWAWRRARIAAFVMRRWPFGDTCLRRALVIGNRLAVLAPDLVIGIRAATSRDVDAHAWLRISGVDLDPLAADYLAFGEP